MKVRIIIVADTPVITDIVSALFTAHTALDNIEIQPVKIGEPRREAIKKAFEKQKPKRKPGRPALGVPDKVLAAVRQLQDSAVARNGGGAPLNEIKKVVRSPSVSPVLTDLIKQKKLVRPKPGYYKVA